MNVPLLDLKAQYKAIKPQLDAAVAEVFKSQHFILGPTVEKCEAALAKYCRSAHAIGVSSGTDAILLSLMAENIGPGHEVITTPFTFFATAGSIARVGARPVFVDIDPVTYNLDVSQVEDRITSATRAIMPVHLYGQMAEMTPLMRVAEKHGLAIIEDAAQAIGSEHKGQRAGSIGHYGCFSFFPSKNLGAAGDAGLVTTQDQQRAEKLLQLRSHGSRVKYHHQFVGGNFRIDALQAAVIAAKLPLLDEWTTARQRNAQRYHRLFHESGLRVAESSEYVEPMKPRGAGDIDVCLPAATTDRHIYNQYVIRVSSRDELKNYLQKKGVITEIYYPVPMHLQECFTYLGYKPGSFPQSERAATEVLALPVYPELTDEQASHVVNSIREFIQQPG